MIYMGSKRRIAKHILTIILADRRPDQYYVEPFVGGANCIDKVTGLRMAGDNNKYLIACLRELSRGWIPPQRFSEEQYKHVRSNKNQYDDHLVGYVGFSLSYGGIFFSGYRKSNDSRDYVMEAYRHASNQALNLKGIEFFSCSYQYLPIPNNSIVYCDPPYHGTSGYDGGKFNHDNLWNWCRRMVTEGHRVFVSERDAPDDFKIVWEGEVKNSVLKQNDGAYNSMPERLYVPK